MRFNLKEKPVSDPASIQRFNQSHQKLTELRTELDRQMNILRESFKLEFTNITKDFFAGVPDVTHVSWTQYTPYFMDGDACEFSVNDIYFNEVEDEDYGDSENGVDIDKLPSDQKELCNKLTALISENEDIMESVFGDHVRVVLTANGAEVTEYEHD